MKKLNALNTGRRYENRETIMILDNINSPKDLKKYSVSELETVADEIREGFSTALQKSADISDRTLVL